MHKILSCRRSIVSIFAIACLTFLGIYHGIDIAGIAIAIAGVAGSLSGANAYQGAKTKEVKKPDSPD